MAGVMFADEVEEEKDSLFSTDDENQQLQRISTVVSMGGISTLALVPQYTDEELSKLVGFIKGMTTLYDLRPTDWSEDTEDAIRTFFLEPKNQVLCIYFSGDSLIAVNGFPDEVYEDLTYFIRDKPREIFDVETFHDNITFGTIVGSVEGTLLELVENVYAPIFFNAKSWPDSVRNDFCDRLHSFLSKLTDVYYKMLGFTVLYIPKEGLHLSMEEATKDKELIKRLEGVVVYWTRQIRIVLQDHDQRKSETNVTPLAELDLWIYRYQNLSGVSQQLTNKYLQKTCNTLNAVQSLYVKQFLSVVDEISGKLEEAKSNIEYLQVLRPSCEDINRCTDVLQIPEKLPRILSQIRFIWLHSKYYNTPARITTLLRYLTTQVIIKCTEFIDLNLVFRLKQTRAAMQQLETSLECCNRYITIYEMISGAHTKLTDTPWELDRQLILGHLDSFMQRLEDMLEICEAMITFARHDETEEIPKPKFTGTRAFEFENWCEKIEDMFNDALNAIGERREIIFDVQSAQWFDEILVFRSRLKDIEIVIENLVNSVFDQVPTVDEGVQALAAFYNYTQRVKLRPLFERKTMYVYELFKTEIQDTKADLIAEREEYPLNMPYYAGRALMASLKGNHLQMLRTVLNKAHWMLSCSIADEVFQQYDKLIASIDEFILSCYRKFSDSIGTDVQSRLERPLMVRSIIKPGLLEVNLDPSLLSMCDEVRFFHLLKYEAPSSCAPVFNKFASIHFVFENVVQVVKDYNKLLASLSEDERILFKQLISYVEKKIAPGLSKLSWINEIVDSYIAECSACTADLQDFVDDYKTCNLEIVSICEKICDTKVIQITTNHLYTLDNLMLHMSTYLEETVDKFLDFIRQILNYLIIVYEGFEQHIQSMADQWIKYIMRFDILLEESLRISVRNSMEHMHETLHGDGIIGPNAVLKLNALLKNNRIVFDPTITMVANHMANVLTAITTEMQAVPRICEKFHIETPGIYPFNELLADDNECKNFQFQINNEVKVNIEKIQEYLRMWNPFRDLFEVDKDKFIERYEMNNPDATDFDANIARYTEMANNCQVMENITSVYFILIDCTQLKKAIIEHCFEWQLKFSTLLFNRTTNMINHVYEYCAYNSEHILHTPQNLAEMSYAIDYYNRLMDEVPIEAGKFQAIYDQSDILDKYASELDPEVKKNMKNIQAEWEKYLSILEEADKMIQFTKNSFRNNLLEEAEDIKRDAQDLFESFMKNGPFSADVKCADALAYLADVRKKIAAIRKREAMCKGNLGIFELSLIDSPDLVALEKELAICEFVWQLTKEWETAWDNYKSGEFWNIRTEDMEDLAQTLFRKLTKLSRELKEKNWSIVESTRSRVDAFRRTLPLISDLKNTAMRPRHWDRVREAMKEDFDQNSPSFNLEAIISMRMIDYAEEINEISNAATMELQIEKGLRVIADTWKTVVIEMSPYKGFYRIKSVDDCFQMLEDNMMQLSTMKSTRFVEPFAKEVDMWERALSYIMECLENGLNVQRQWFYLENIFGGEDIRRQLPKETKEFDGLTNEWKEISTRMALASNAFKAVNYIPSPQLLTKFNRMNDKLESIQRSLEAYLETKRHVFPRFYFISNDDMLEILGNSKKPEMVQPHFRKLFDNIIKLKLVKNPVSTKTEAFGMYSDDGEYMEFPKLLVIDGQVETWLCDIETTMKFTLKTEFRPCRAALKKMLSKRDKWLLTYCGQLCNACSQMQWTTDCTRALVHCKLTESKKPMKRIRKKQNRILMKLSELSRRELPKLQRLKANALITIEIHSRDVIDRMYKANCMDTGAFEWFSQLRFYWDRDVDDCVIRQTNTHFMYGYEYNGNSGRLVITPLTDRCYITLTTALHLFRGGSPKGPAGTGKTETVKDLGKAMGLWVIVNNCSEGLDYKSMGKSFSGLSQTGAWGCFDEFNRINIEVLSVVAQQIMCILAAVSQKLKSFVFEGIEIELKLTVGIFITMNPGYAGRTELPDNLKSMFRPISMMVPDTAIIAENTLFSDGFQNARQLAKKVFTLYQLSTRQLSKQDHYDFGLRSMVALLRYAGRKRRQFPNVPEDQIVYLAMKDMNVARFTSNDLPLFNGIMGDIFPGVTLPVIEYEDMTAAIRKEFDISGMQPIQTAITKVIQLYETKNSRHSVMILGKTGTAKSVTWKTLRDSLSRLKREGKSDYNIVVEYPINPKALNLAELYGEYNLSTGEWTDGVISATMRATCSDESPDEKWILFDGPVDAVWIENMNSVMDDNKILTLINSDRITMPMQVSLLFEVGDLSVASPATVSRCGMVYNDYKDWGWQPYVTSWIKTMESRGAEYQDIMKQYFNYYLQPLLDFKRLNCEETVVCNELNLVMSFCRLLNIFATKENGIDNATEDQFEDMSKIWFLFCLIWSVCATVNELGRKKLDTYIREREGVFPLKDTVYEYFVDVKNKCFAAWDEKLNQSWRFDDKTEFYKIIVPTIDTVRYEFIVGYLLGRGHPVLLCGPVGTGKTSTAYSVLNGVNKDKFVLLNINMSAQTSSLNVQEAIEGRTEKRTKNSYAPPGGKCMITFLDDLNMPAKETYGSQPPLELLRQWLDYGFWYDRQKQWRKYIQNMFIMAAMGPPGGGRNVISERFQSRFNVINMPFPAETTISQIFGTMIIHHVSDFYDDVKAVARTLTDATIELYFNVVAKMLPTPKKTHYLFNLRDISRVFQGMLRAHKDNANSKMFILKLWIHECFRVFSDRMVEDKDREWFKDQMNEQLGRHFEITLHSICPNREVPLFGDFMHQFGLYEDFNDMEALRNHVAGQMEEYNVSPGVVRMDLVLFREVLDHCCRIVRVVSQPRGNMLLIGIGGSGRQSVSRIAAYIAELNTFQISVTRSYKVVEFKEDLKKLNSLTGCDAKGTSFLFNDTQVMDESFLEIINNLLSSGEVANLYKADEFEEIKAKLYPAVVKNNIPQTNEEIYAFFIQRVRQNLHIILCMSPIGDAFRNRLRQYPALINATTIDWFSDWPKQALLEVAQKYVADVNFVETITGEASEDLNRDSLILSTQDRLRMAVADIFSTIHTNVSYFAKRMAEELKRYSYVTPVNYIELVGGYKNMLDAKRLEISSQANKLRSGLWKIEDTRSKVETMSVELAEAQIKVNEFQEECDEMMLKISVQQKDADEQAKQVQATSVKISEEEVVCKKLADVAQADLDEAMPALNEAIMALDALNKKDISEMKSYSKPPQKVEMVMEAVMILKQVEPTWTEAKKQLGEQKFLDDLRDFDKNHISEKTLKKIANYTSNEEFVPDKIGTVSLAAKSLCMWVIAIEKYAKVWKYVAPKQAKLDDALMSLQEKQALLAAAKAKLDELNEMLARLQAEYDEKVAQKDELNRRAEQLRIQLERASLLVENLAGEKIRWENTVANLDVIFDSLPGDCLLATAFISYLGPFVSEYRDEMISNWTAEVIENEIPASEVFNFIGFLADPTTIREWNMQGLPSDSFSIENGIIITRGTRWPLVIDPQCQAQKWIKAMENDKDLKVIDFGMPDFMKYIENAVQFGKPVFLQNIAEIMDPSLNPILDKAVVKQGGMDLIKLDDKMVSYDWNFRFFISTKLNNPHYPPEISTKTTLVNFAIKQQGLEDQLLGIIVRKERPQLEEQKDEMVTSIAKGKRTLIDLENDLLRLLNEARGSLLEDAELFNTLQISKQTSIAVQKSLEISETTEVEIDQAREGYRPCAERASILFFVLNDMGKIDPMYQFALDSYIFLFTQSIERSPKSQSLVERIDLLNEYHTYAVYKNTCRAIFEQHKLLFSFHMCIKILDAQGKVVPAEYNFLLKGGVVLDRSNQPDNPCSWLIDVAWDNVTELDKLTGFHGVANTFEQYPKDWYQWYVHTEPETQSLIGDWDEICSEFQKMLFVRSLRPDRISFCVSSFIINQLGNRFVEPPVLDIKAVLNESIPQTPLIFVLSPGVDPTNSLVQLAETAKMSSKFHALSLGQGQAPVATKLLSIGASSGHWIFLANCHLSLSWMPKLDKIVETLQSGKVNPKFRLWLSSSPHPEFPISILQSGIKMTTEPPRGIRANLKRLYQLITEEQFNTCQAKEKYKKLLFSLCFFHAILIERKKFQQLGWNSVYSFNDADFEVSENLLTIYLDEYQQTPWDALKYLIAGVNYGGHVTDDWDRRLLLTYINHFFCDDAITSALYRLSSLGTYYIPRDGSLQSYQDYITLLPTVDRPEAFGQHPNADITSLISESRMLFETLMSLQVQAAGTEEESTEDKVMQLAGEVLLKIPEPMDYESTEKLIGTVKAPLEVVLLQQILIYNKLLISMKVSLEELQKGIQGLVVMSTELEEIFICFVEGRVPSTWKNAYSSLKLLGSWTRDLIQRVEHFATWAETIHPPLHFWLSAFTFPTGFLTAVLQTEARILEVPIDTLGWEFIVSNLDDYMVQLKPESGVYCRGLFLEGAGWDKKNACLVEPQPMQLVTPMPLINFKPVEQLKKRTRGLYEAPCYYFPIREGTQGKPAFIVGVDLKSGIEGSDFWVKRGTALLLSLAN